MSKLLRGQEQISAKRPMPVNDINISSQVLTSSPTTVQLYYYASGVRTMDSGQAAGTVVDFTFEYKNILSSLGTTIASKNDTSLSFTCSALTTELDWESRPDIATLWESLDNQSSYTLSKQIGALLKNGEFVIDYRRGVGIGKKATTESSMTNVIYKYSNTLTSIGSLQLNSSGAASGGSAGGGNNTYSTEQGDFSATVTDSTYSIVLSTDTIGGQTITEANFANGILKVMDVSASPKEFKTITLNKFTWNSSTKTLDVTNCTGAFLFGTGDIVSLTLTGADKIRDAATDSQKTSLIRDVSDQYGNETLIDTTNVAAGTNYYPSPSGSPMDNSSTLSIQGKTSGGVTTTIEATNDDSASPDWFDISKSFTDLVTNTSGNASYVDANFILVPTGRDVLNVKAIRIKSVTSTSTNVVKYNIRKIY